MTDMTLYHTGPEITAITRDGSFGSMLFFASRPYHMIVNPIIYQTKIDRTDIIAASSLLYHENALILQPLTEEIMALVGCDEETADRLLSQSTDIYRLDLGIDPAALAEMSWTIQALTGKAALMLGYRGVSMQDEQGTCYLVDMFGREADLVRVE